MPSPLEHLSIALDVLSGTGVERPAMFLAGAVAPDIDKLLGLPRAQTHWWLHGSDLSGAIRLVAEKPQLRHLASGSDLSSFVAGYLCHLVVDEQWTLRIYRKHFGRYSAFRESRDGAEHQSALHSSIDTILVESGRLTVAARLLVGGGTYAAVAREVVGRHGDRIDTLVASVVARAHEPDARARFELMAGARMTASIGSEGLAPGVADGAARRMTFLERLADLERAATTLVGRAEIADFRSVATSAASALVEQFRRGEVLEPPPGTSAATYFDSPTRSAL